MSSFLAQGKRKSEAKSRKATRKRVKEVYKILHEMDVVATKMIESGIIINEDNVVEEAAKYTKREIGGYEKMLLLGKTSQVYDVIRKRQLKEEEE